MQAKLSTQSYKGARDFYPEDMQIQQYIYDVWTKACRKFGFERYDFPILEPFEIFAAKTGQEIVNNELFSFEDKAGRKVAVRPELTPGTVRMIAQRFNELTKPIKWFMIGNNWRYEKPQTGRGREFYQLEVNTFGIDSVTADFEIFLLIVSIMKDFGATSDQFELRFSDRKILSALLTDSLGLDTETSEKTRKLMDKFKKLKKEAFEEELTKYGLDPSQIKQVLAFLNSDFEGLSKIIDPKILSKNQGYTDLLNLVKMLNEAGLLDYCSFDPTIIRGFDYSDGLVYEVFDKNPNNRRSLFGGERFDKLINIFGNYSLPATGFAMGDWTLKEFLTNWNLLPKFAPQAEYFVTTWPSDDPKYFNSSLETTQKLRERGKNVFMWLETTSKLDKQLKYADKKSIPYALIVGETELKNNEITIKDLRTKVQSTLKLRDFLNSL